MNVFDLAAKLTLDTSEYESNLTGAEGKTQSFGSKLKSGLSTAAKVGAAAITAAAAGVSALVKSSVEAYGNYEQLVGGVETLFGNSASVVQEYAANAFKTAGLSANEYMETVTSFSASLLQSLGGDTAQAAEMADMAITDMSDNANKMGTDMAAIQNAYQGFAKQNFTMLDNLKLGYGGTKEEMQRLIDDANKLREAQGLNADLTIDSYADIVEAIHTVQTEMGITGTTAKEASSTIQGSISSMKSAWQNFVAGLGNSNADLGALIDDLISSATTAFDNLMPVIEQALVGIGTALETMAPIIAERLPAIIQQVLPSLLMAATSLIQGLIAALPGIIQVLIDVLPDIIIQITTALISNLPAILEAGLQLAMGLIEALLSVLGQLAEVGWQWVQSIAQGIGEKISEVVSKANELWQQAKAALASAVSAMLQTGIDWITNLIQGIGQKIGEVVAKANELWQQARDAIANAVSHFREVGSNLIGGLISGIVAKAQEVVERVRGVVSNAIQAAKNLLGISSPSKVFRQFGQYLDEGLMLGIKDAAQQPVNAIKSVAASLAKAWDAAGFSMDGNLSANWLTGDSMGSFRSYNYDRGSARMGARGNARIGGGITLNVYAAQGQSEESIAARVERRLAEAMGKREAVWQ